MIYDQATIDLFSYSDEERLVFPYIARYISSVEPRMASILKSETALVRFFLAGLFLTYRACNSSGQEMSVEPSDIRLPEVHLRRLEQYSRCGGPKFLSTKEYLKLLGVSRLGLLLKRPDVCLVDAVLSHL